MSPSKQAVSKRNETLIDSRFALTRPARMERQHKAARVLEKIASVVRFALCVSMLGPDFIAC